MKKIILMLCSVLCIFGMTACGKQETAGNAAGNVSNAELVSYTEGILQFMQNLNAAAADQIDQMEDSDIESAYGITADVFPDFDVFRTGVKAYCSNIDNLGNYVGIQDSSVTRSDEETEIELVAEYEKHKLKFTLTLDAKYRITGMSADVVLTKAEILQKALVNTLLGMGVVFVVLIFISFIISAFGLIPKLFGKKKEKKAEVTEKKTETAAIETEEEELTDDLELVAVITAAVAAASGSSTDGFVVRSIKRAAKRRW